MQQIAPCCIPRVGKMVHPPGIEHGRSGRVVRAAGEKSQTKFLRLLSVEKIKEAWDAQARPACRLCARIEYNFCNRIVMRNTQILLKMANWKSPRCIGFPVAYE